MKKEEERKTASAHDHTYAAWMNSDNSFFVNIISLL